MPPTPDDLIETLRTAERGLAISLGRLSFRCGCFPLGTSVPQDKCMAHLALEAVSNTLDHVPVEA